MPGRRPIARRSFLKRTAALAAAAGVGPAIVPSSIFGAEGQVAPSNRVAVGLIALGRQAMGRNLSVFLRWPDSEVVALCDVDRWRLDTAYERAAGQFGKDIPEVETLKTCPRYTDFREVLARKDVDAVMISSPDHWHVPMAIAAAKAGKDICCEKPLSQCIAAGRLLSDTVREHDRVFRTDSEFRSIPLFHRACELVINGRIGQLQTIRMAVPNWNEPLPQQPEMPVPEDLDYDLWLGPAPSRPYTEKRVHPPKSYGRPGWYANQDYCDGVIVNWGHHLADVAQWANGTERSGPVEVEGTGDFPPADGLWNVLLGFKVQYRYANGVRLFYTVVPPSGEQPYVRFEGSEGWIHVLYGPDKLTAEPASILDSEIGPDETRFPLKNEKRDFIDCVKTRSQTMEDAEVGHRATSLCQLGYIAVRTGEKLQWDPEKEQFQNSDAANKLLTRPPWREPWTV
ncbi:MAG: Gfo/Idh/MocA family oxidoreductase [Planctomycetota bacterium]